MQEPWYSDVDASTQELVQTQEEALQKTFDRMVAKAEVASNWGDRLKGSIPGMLLGMAVGIAIEIWYWY